MCVFGRDSFLAWGVAALDLSFGRTIQTESEPDQMVDSSHHFLGCAVGHRAVIGQGVRLAPGAVVPSGATLVGPVEGLFRQWGAGPADGRPVRPEGQTVVALGRSADRSDDLPHALRTRLDDPLFGDDAGDETGGRDVEGEVPSR